MKKVEQSETTNNRSNGTWIIVKGKKVWRQYDTCPGCPEPGFGPGACYCD